MRPYACKEVRKGNAFSLYCFCCLLNMSPPPAIETAHEAFGGESRARATNHGMRVREDGNHKRPAPATLNHTHKLNRIESIRCVLRVAFGNTVITLRVARATFVRRYSRGQKTQTLHVSTRKKKYLKQQKREIKTYPIPH